VPDRMRGTLAISSNNGIKRLGWFRGLRWKDIFIWRYEPKKEQMFWRRITMIYNMDCIEGTKQYIKDESVDLIVTDPPYNLGFGGTSQTKSKKLRCSIIANDKLSDRNYQ
jgi:hypothetical protein